MIFRSRRGNAERKVKVNFISMEEFAKDLKKGGVISTLAPANIVRELDRLLEPYLQEIEGSREETT